MISANLFSLGNLRMQKYENSLNQGGHSYNWKGFRYSPPYLTWRLHVRSSGPTTQQGTFPMNWQVSLWSRSSQWFEDPGYQDWTQISYPTGELPIPRLAQPQPTLSTYWTLFPLSAKRVWLKLLVCPSGINPMGILLKAAWEKEEEVLLSWSEKQAEQRGTDVSLMRQVTGSDLGPPSCLPF